MRDMPADVVWKIDVPRWKELLFESLLDKRPQE